MNRFLSILTALGLCASTVSAAWQGTATASFAVKATMDSFVGQAPSDPIELADGATEFPVTFQILKLDTGKKKRDVEMQHMFHAEEHPTLTGVAKAQDLLKLETGGELPVTLTIAGQTHEVPATISEIAREDGKLSFTAYLEISLKSFGLKPPSIMKIINVGDVVKVTTRFELIGQ